MLCVFYIVKIKKIIIKWILLRLVQSKAKQDRMPMTWTKKASSSESEVSTSDSKKLRRKMLTRI